MVSFAEPTVLWLLMVVALAAVLTVYRHRRRMLQQRRLASPGVWRRLMGGTPATGLLRMLAWCVAAALVVVAAALALREPVVRPAPWVGVARPAATVAVFRPSASSHSASSNRPIQ